MGLSPSTLFHFTNKDGLMGILADDFRLKYCLEEFNHPEKAVQIANPMVSFCDIKLSEINDHISKYGFYGIGLSKKWAIENGLNPVLYMNDKSNLPIELITTIRNLESTINKKNYHDLTNVLRYTKVYEGTLNRGVGFDVIENYRFADEREWRFVPPIRPHSKFRHWLLKSQYDTQVKKDVENRKLSTERLKFNANQISYIIVKDESDIDEIINHIRSVKSKNYTSLDINRLTTRILTCDNILHDF